MGRPRRLRLTAAGGIVGPAAFVTAWAVAGARTPGYSPVEDAISRLAAIGAPHRPLMTAGFVVFGVAVPAFGLALRDELDDGPAWIAAVATGLATLGVAATPLDDGGGDDTAHAVAATIGYVTLAATPLLAASHLEGRRRTVARAVGTVAAASLAATTVGPASGLFQRMGLTVVDAWLGMTAWRMLRRR